MTENQQSEPAVERKFLGVVEVDSGTLVVGDPGYMLPRADQGRPGIDYQAVIDQIIKAPDSHADYLADQPVLLISGFGGDGTYPVFGEFEDGELIRVTIDLIPLEPDED